MGDTGSKLDHDDKKVKDIQGRLDGIQKHIDNLTGKPGKEKQLANLQQDLAEINEKLEAAEAAAAAD